MLRKSHADRDPKWEWVKLHQLKVIHNRKIPNAC